MHHTEVMTLIGLESIIILHATADRVNEQQSKQKKSTFYKLINHRACQIYELSISFAWKCDVY